MSKSENISDKAKFIVILPEPSKSTDRYGNALFYFASDVSRAIEAAGGRVEFKRVEARP
jgi:hypothetical protein